MQNPEKLQRLTESGGGLSRYLGKHRRHIVSPRAPRLLPVSVGKGKNGVNLAPGVFVRALPHSVKPLAKKRRIVPAQIGGVPQLVNLTAVCPVLLPLLFGHHVARLARGTQEHNLLSRQNVRLLGGGKPFKSSHNALGKRQFPRRELRGKIFRDLFAEGAVFFLQDIFVSFGHRNLFPHGTC